MSVVIGAGHHGLVAALRLAEHGRDVVVLEASDIPGGGVRSEALTEPGYVHDSCSAFFPLAAASPVFRALELDVDWVDPPLPMVHVLDEEGSAIGLYRDIGATVASLEAAAAGAGRGWSELVRTLWPYRQDLIRVGLSRLPPVGPAARLGLRMRSRAIELAPLALASSAALGRGILGSDLATGWLAATGAHADLSPLAAGSGAFALGLTFLGHVVGWPFPRGGAGRLTDALIARLRAAGGELRCGARVEEVELARGRVRAVRLEGGERLESESVICTASPHLLASMLPAGALPGRVERRLRSWRYGLGTVKLDWALAEPVPWSSSAAREAGVVHTAGPVGQVIASLEQAGRGLFPEHPALVMGQQSVHDASRAPEGRHTLYAYARVPQRPGLGSQEMAERVEVEIERYAPGFRARVLARSVRSPADIEAANPSLVGGDLAAGSCELDQQLIFRPAVELCRGRTPVRGLYVAGPWVHPGPGVHGVSGWAAARAVLGRRGGPERAGRWRATALSARPGGGRPR